MYPPVSTDDVLDHECISHKQDDKGFEQYLARYEEAYQATCYINHTGCSDVMEGDKKIFLRSI